MPAIDDLNSFLDTTGIVIAPVDEYQGRLAVRARILFGRGMGHGGVLNDGDTFSYAPAGRPHRRCGLSATTSRPPT